MRRTKLLTLAGSLCLILVLAAMPFLAACPAPAPPPAEEEEGPPPAEEEEAPPKTEWTPPKTIGWSVLDIASSTYVVVSAVSNAVYKRTGTKISLIPCGTDVERLIPLLRGDVAGCVSGGALYCAAVGMFDFGTYEWGPQPLRIFYMNAMEGFGQGCFVRGTSDIYTPADIKGKRVGYVPGAPGTNVYAEAVLAFANLTWDDVVRVPYASYDLAVKGVLAGTCDVGTTVTLYTACQELASSIYGIRWLPLPAADKEGWKRAQAVCAWYGPGTSTVGAGLSNDNPAETGTQHPALTFYTLDKVDENLIYWLVKQMDESYDMYKSASVPASLLTIEKTLDLDGSPMTYHEGAVRYFKEIGVWTAELDALHKERLERHTQLINEVWPAAVEEGLAKELSIAEFQEFWNARLKAWLRGEG